MISESLFTEAALSQPVKLNRVISKIMVEIEIFFFIEVIPFQRMVRLLLSSQLETRPKKEVIVWREKKLSRRPKGRAGRRERNANLRRMAEVTWSP